MSIKWMSAVIHQYQGPPARKLVLMALADCASDTSGRAWPSYAYLATAAGVSRDTAKRHIRSLIAEGCIIAHRRPRQASIYHLQPPDTWGQNALGAKCPGGTGAPGVGAQLCPHPRGTAVPPEPSMNRQGTVRARTREDTSSGEDPQERERERRAAAEAYLQRLRDEGALYVDQDRAAWLKARTAHGERLVLRALAKTDDPRIGPVLQTCIALSDTVAEEERIARFHAAQAERARQDRVQHDTRAAQRARHRRLAMVLIRALDRAAPPPDIVDRHRTQLADLRRRLQDPQSHIPPMWAMYRWPIDRWLGRSLDDLAQESAQ